MAVFKTLVIVFVIFLMSASQIQATVLWSADHETGDISQWRAGTPSNPWVSGPGETFYSIVDSPVHSGTKSLKTVIDTTKGNAGMRWAQRTIGKSQALPDEAYYSTWFYLPQKMKSDWWNFMQWKRAYDYGDGRRSSDPVASVNFQERANGNLYFILNYKVGNDGGYKTSGWGDIASASIDIPLNQWVHLECFYKWSTSKTGEITCWQDEQQIFSVKNVITEFDYPFPDDVIRRQFAVNAYAQNVSPVPYTLYFDDVAISTHQVGVGEAQSGTVASPSPSPSSNSCPADLNNDNVVNIQDYSILVSNFLKSLNQSNNPKADINSDGKINIIDYHLLANSFLKLC